MKYFYGLTSHDDLVTFSKRVCDCLGHGKNHSAVDLLIETAGAETVRGTFEDPTKFAGMGLTQFDKMPFQDVKDRTSKANKLKIFNTFGIHLDHVVWEHLRYSPLLALIMTRLKYMLIPEHIPPDFEDRARYWKKHYNTIAGKGTEEHYIYQNMKFM